MVKLLSRSIIAALAGVTVCQVAGAHAKLVSADPPAGGTARPAVRRLDLSFSEEISAKLSGATVKTGGGAVPATASVGKGGKSLSLMLGQPLKPGAYTVDWHAVASDDGHRTSGTYGFSVK